jgi:sterol desaturase/sphingolipid hydroxylase (fatty acid hydroxylase superfamily)
MLPIIEFGAAFFVVFETACLIQAALHHWIGHGTLLSWIGQIHVGSHHAFYTPRHYESNGYNVHEEGLGYTYLPIAAATAVMAYFLLPAFLAVAVGLALVAVFGAHEYVHKHFHITGSWLLRYGWFRKKKEIHRIHHVNPGKNYGVLTTAWDRLAGTFARPGERSRKYFTQ